jgi:PHD/YefM family antitoxin component YafN of YafNO toxin-antitoxin module
MIKINIKPSAAIRKNYNEISSLCKTTKEPVFLTKNGEGDLVVMDIATYSQRESMLRLREQLVAVEEDRLAGKKGFSIGQLDEMIKKAISETVNGQH